MNKEIDQAEKIVNLLREGYPNQEFNITFAPQIAWDDASSVPTLRMTYRLGGAIAKENGRVFEIFDVPDDAQSLNEAYKNVLEFLSTKSKKELAVKFHKQETSDSKITRRFLISR